MRDALRTGALAGIFTALFLGLAEAAVNAGAVLASGSTAAAILGAPVFYVALFVPTFALGGALAGAWLWSWHGLDGEALCRRVQASWHAFEAGSLFWPALLTGVPIAGIGLVGIGARLYLLVRDAFQNQVLAGVLLATLALLCGAAWIGAVVAALRLAGLAIEQARVRTVALAPLLDSRRIAAAVIGLELLAAAIALGRVSGTLSDIGVAALVAIALPPPVFAASFVTISWLGFRRPSLALGPVVVLALALGPLVLAVGLGQTASVRNAALVQGSVSWWLVGLYQRVSDFDRDGASSLFGGGDCAPFDARVGPDRPEIPGNGVDDNCIGGDAARDTASYGALDNPAAFVPPPSGFPSRPDLLLVTIDALRADHMSLHGYARATTPRLDRLAKSAVVFEHAYSQGTGTISSMPSLFSSKHSYQLRYDDDRSPPAISESETLVAEHLGGAGYATAGVSTIRYTHDGRWRLLQGFHDLDLELTDPDPAYKITSPEVLASALAFLEGLRRHPQPFFLWVHFYDVHSAYLEHPGQPSFGKRPEDLYDGEILYTDRHVAELLDAAFAQGARPLVVILAADHGEGFRSDRGMTSHAYGLFNELLHVPLVVWAPGAPPRRVSSPVANLDVGATLLNAAGVRQPRIMGHTLFPYLYEKHEDPERIVFSEKTFANRQAGTKRSGKSAIGSRWKMVRWLGEERDSLFDLGRDPGEKHNVLLRHPDVAQKYGRLIDELVERIAIDAGPGALGARAAAGAAERKRARAAR